MISVIRNKRTGHVSAPGSRAFKERQAKEREKEVRRDFEIVNELRHEGNDFYFTGRRRPLIEDDQ